MEQDYIFKIILVGNGNSGKTSLLYHYLTNKVHENPQQTLGVEFSTKNIEVLQKNIKLQIWDTAGQEKFRSVAKTYYRGAIGALILFDITNIESFESLDQWIRDAREASKNDLVLVIVGNKIDLYDQRVVPTSEAQKFCSSHSIGFVETSAITGHNIDWAVQLLCQKILERIQRGIIDGNQLKPKLQNRKVEQQQQRQCQC